MKELKPLLRDDASAFERQLLNAVRRERPSPQLRARMRGTLGLTGPVAWLGAARAALSTVAGKSAVGVAVVGLVGGLVVGGLVAGGLVATGVVGGGGGEHVTPKAPNTALAAPTPPAVPAATEAAATEAAVPQPSAGVPAADTEDPGDRQLREEILLLDGARSALQRGSRATGLRELDRYRERFPEGILSREAAQLRQQARAKAPVSGAR